MSEQTEIDYIVDENSPQINQPGDIKIPLKPHQLAMICKMNEMEKPGKKKFANNQSYTTNFGALCDRVGAGKSLTILGLIGQNKILKLTEKCIRSYGTIVNIFTKNENSLPINIIVVPHGIVNQWSEYIEKYTKLSYIIIKNNKQVLEFKEKINNFVSSEEHSLEHLNMNIVLISSTQYNKVAKLFYVNIPIGISRLIIDEVDSIKIPASEHIDAEFTWFISSSRLKLENPRGQIVYVPSTYVNWNGEQIQTTRRTLVDKINHIGYFRDTLLDLESLYFKNYIFLKSKEEFVTNSFHLPDIKFEIIKCLGNIYTNVLNGIVSQDVMNMINAGDIKSAVISIGCDTQDEAGLIKLVTKDLEKNLNNKQIEYEAKQQMHYSSATAKQAALDKLKVDIKELENKIESIKERVIDTNACPICCDDISNKTILQCCNNAFCFECISMSLNHKPSCPLCRKKIGNKDLIVIKEKLEEQIEECQGDDDSKRTKLENLIKYLEKIMPKPKSKIKKRKRKILIFSEFEQSFNDIENYLMNSPFKYDKLKGSTSAINNKVRKYKEDDIDILLLNSKYFGSGLNLENTTDMFIFHKMNTSMEKQVIGRAQRPGRKDQLKVYRLCYDNEL